MERIVKRVATIALVLAGLLAVTGCGALGEKVGTGGGTGPVSVVTTTNFITDVAREVGGDRVTVNGLMGPGIDPHLYKASAGDVTDLREADVVFYGGLYLEAKMQEVFEELGESRPVYAVTAKMPRERLIAAPSGAPSGEEYDPHVWFDVSLWKFAVKEIRDGLIDVDPAGEAEYRRNAKAYLGRLDRLDREVERGLASIPERRRGLGTSHDAFRYLGQRYGLDVEAIQGISTATEATTSDIERVAGVIADRGVKAIFVESSVPPQTIEAVLAAAAERGQETVVGGELFSDAAGEAGTPEGTYTGMVRSNLENLVRGLR
ncbi:MAG: zinc ABC transporter substrate-binding protein [Actinomycetota bacterium]|nr:zinc ABC transporter substrate-binding protein [Actinomycetota bacterium]